MKNCASSTASPKFNNLVMKLIWRYLKIMPETSNELNYSAIVLDSGHTPYRTHKAIVCTLVQIKGNDILHDSKESPAISEIRPYSVRVCMKIDSVFAQQMCEMLRQICRLTNTTSVLGVHLPLLY